MPIPHPKHGDRYLGVGKDSRFEKGHVELIDGGAPPSLGAGLHFPHGKNPIPLNPLLPDQPPVLRYLEK